MDRIRTITHKGKQITVIDLSHASPEDIRAAMDDVRQVITSQPRGSVLTMSIYEGAQFDHDAITRMKEVAVFDRPHVKRAAIAGANSLPDVFHKALQTFSVRDFPRFATQEEALEYLVKE